MRRRLNCPSFERLGFAAGCCAEGSPECEIDVVADGANGVVQQHDMHDSGVIAGSCHGGVSRAVDGLTLAGGPAFGLPGWHSHKTLPYQLLLINILLVALQRDDAPQRAARTICRRSHF